MSPEQNTITPTLSTALMVNREIIVDKGLHTSLAILEEPIASFFECLKKWQSLRRSMIKVVINFGYSTFVAVHTPGRLHQLVNRINQWLVFCGTKIEPVF